VPNANMEILTADEVAAWLKISKGQVYEMSKERTRTGEVRSNPIPSLRIGSSVRFRKSDVEEWIEKLVARGR
jgi:excisionase family DNA binding protein